MSIRSSNIKIGIIIPSFFESQFIDRSIPGVSNIVFGVSGMGKLRSSWTARTMIEGGCKAILLSGFAGGINNLKKGDVIVVDWAYQGDYDARPFEEEYPAKILCRHIEVKSSKPACMFTQDRFLTKNEYTGLFPITANIATDMESYAVGFAGESLGVPVFVVKMISDLVNGDSEGDFLSACSKMSGRLNEVISESISLIRRKAFNESNS